MALAFLWVLLHELCKAEECVFAHAFIVVTALSKQILVESCARVRDVLSGGRTFMDWFLAVSAVALDLSCATPCCGSVMLRALKLTSVSLAPLGTERPTCLSAV